MTIRAAGATPLKGLLSRTLGSTGPGTADVATGMAGDTLSLSRGALPDLAATITRPRLDGLETSATFKAALARGAEPAQPGTSGVEDAFLMGVLEEQGFAGTPTAVSPAVFDRLLAEGAIEKELYRGFDDPAHVAQFLHGKNYVNGGLRAYGGGIYAAAGPEAQEMAARYADDTGGAVLRLGLKKGARVGDYRALTRGLGRDKAKALRAVHARLQPALEKASAIEQTDPAAAAALRRQAGAEAERARLAADLRYRDVGVYATEQGLDAVEARHGIVVLLNRTALVGEQPVRPGGA